MSDAGSRCCEVLGRAGWTAIDERMAQADREVRQAYESFKKACRASKK